MFEQASHYLDKHSTLKWAHSFLTDLKRAHQPSNLSYFMGASFNNYKRLMHYNKNFIKITDGVMDQIQKKYQNSKNRLIVIDHEGTLPRKIASDPEPSQQIVNILD